MVVAGGCCPAKGSLHHPLSLGGVQPASCLGLCPDRRHEEPRQRHVFSPGGDCEPSPELLSLLLLLSGDVELNPGPFPCPVCSRNYSRSRGTVGCSVCGRWLCLTRNCSGLTKTRQHTPGWCRSAPPPGIAASGAPQLGTAPTLAPRGPRTAVNQAPALSPPTIG